MPTRTIAAIIGPGRHGAVVGTGSFLRQRSVLVHPPLSHALVSGSIDRADLRVCLATWENGQARAEIVDVEDITVAGAEWAASAGAVTAAQNPLVSLTLATAVTMTVVSIRPTKDAILAHLANPFDGTLDDPGHNNNPLCRMFGICCS